MVFSSMTFLFGFLPIVLLLYYICPMKIKNLIILISGIIFYAWGEPLYVICMLLTTVIDYTAGLMIDKYDDNEKIRKLCLLVSLCLNLGLLFVFKYGSFVIGNINQLFGTEIFDPKLPLPIGISFYTFQSMSYTIDMYRRDIKVQKNIISYISYVSLFPQIVAGPIVRYSDVAKEIDSRTITTTKVADGIGIFIKGLAKKVFIANNIGAVWASVKVMDYNTMPALTAWIGILAFTFQIYFDFSGYSDMAIGLGKMLGFEFPINFDYPYTSKSVSEFWRRWHITLGSWFKSYVYFPLGGNRGTTLQTVRNLFVVWFLTGLWHGASWNFVLWGVFYGVLIIMEKLFLNKLLVKLPKFIQWLYTFLMVVFGWVLFEMKTIGQIGQFFGAMFGLNRAYELSDRQSIYLIVSNLVIFMICIICSSKVIKKISDDIKAKHQKLDGVLRFGADIVLFAISLCYLVTSTYNPFLYFNF